MEFVLGPNGSMQEKTPETAPGNGDLIKVKSDGPNGEQNPWIAQVRAQYYF